MAEHRDHVPFSLVLAGGGARGFAHVGVLRALERRGWRPSALVGVSMGALVAATYALRSDWYRALLTMDTHGFPHPGRRGPKVDGGPMRLRDTVGRARVAWNMMTGWGAPDRAVGAGHRLLESLLGDRVLEDARVPVVVCATDLLSGRRVEIRTGLATEAVYASSALAGIVPPLDRDGHLLVDGVYADIAPVDVARRFELPVVIVVDPTQPTPATDIHNGAQAVLRAMEICHLKHAELRFAEADLVVHPTFSRYVDTLDFDTRRECIAAGVRAARAVETSIRAILGRPDRQREFA